MTTVTSAGLATHVPRVSASFSRPRPFRLTMATFIGLIAAHGLMAMIFRSVPALSGVHAVASVLTGLALAVSKRPDRAVYAAAYIAGAEVLWRMTHAPIFWETGKYAVALILGVYLARVGLRRSASLWPLVYLALLLPSCLITVNEVGFSRAARDAISFNLSGPVSLAICLAAFASCDLSRIRLSRLLMSLVWPIAGIGTLAAYSTITASSIQFSTESNFTTSGGYGPNQVSAILSIGSLACILMALLDGRRRIAIIFYALGAGLLFQAVLTFSRGGVYAVLVCLAVLLAHYLWRPQIGIQYLLAVIAVTLASGAFLVPRLNAWTDGALAERYASLDTTHRTEIASEDLDLFRENPVAGVGVGLAKFKRKNARYLGIAPHTEFSRLLAEHGALGALALLVLGGLTAARYVTAPTLAAKGWVCSLTVWCFATMSVSAMRLSVLGVLFGIAYLPWEQMRTRKVARK